MSSQKELIIFSVYHKEYLTPQVDYIIPVHAGKQNATLNLPFIGDNVGENISHLNSSFCELTVLYCIWKNKLYNNAAYWGLAHYRRYLIADNLWIKLNKIKQVKYELSTKNFEIVFCQKHYQKLLNYLQQGFILIPNPPSVINKTKGIFNLKQHYCIDHDPLGWQAMEDAIKKLYPNYTNSFNAVGESNRFIPYNIMMAPVKFYNEYLTWLFAIMFEINKTYEIPTDSYQSRALGFMSERLMNVYLHQHKSTLKLKHLPIAMFI
ncbi:MAG: DUF4422 domain-containing protein [Chitinophagaceae bacterium]